MVRRATDGTQETSVQRIARRAEEDRQDNRAGFKAILESIETLRTEVRRGAQNTYLLEQRFNDLEFQVNLTRDEVQKRATNPAPSQIASAKIAIKDSVKSPWGRVSLIIAGITSAAVLGGTIPKIVTGAERFWDFLAGREVKALSRPLKADVPDK